MTERRRWVAFWILCLGELMVVLDSTVVNVALPSIRKDLGFSEESLAWVVNGYLLTFGGCLLLGGRLGDLYGQRRGVVTRLTAVPIAPLRCRPFPPPSELRLVRPSPGGGGRPSA